MDLRWELAIKIEVKPSQLTMNTNACLSFKRKRITHSQNFPSLSMSTVSPSQFQILFMHAIEIFIKITRKKNISFSQSWTEISRPVNIEQKKILSFSTNSQEKKENEERKNRKKCDSQWTYCDAQNSLERLLQKGLNAFKATIIPLSVQFLLSLQSSRFRYIKNKMQILFLQKKCIFWLFVFDRPVTRTNCRKSWTYAWDTTGRQWQDRSWTFTQHVHKTIVLLILFEYYSQFFANYTGFFAIFMFKKVSQNTEKNLRLSGLSEGK